MAGGEKFLDLLAQNTIGTKGPTNVVRVAVDSAGLLWVSVKGAAYVPFSSVAGNFGANTIVPLLDSNNASVEAIRLLTEFRVNTAGAVESRWRIFGELASVETEMGGWEFQGASFPMMYVGPQANTTGMRAIGASNADLMVGGSAAFSISTTACTSQQPHTFNDSAQYRALQGTMSTNTYQRTIGNAQIIPAGSTVNGVTNGTAATGFSLKLKCTTGSTIVHNSGTPGTGAFKLINRTAANYTTVGWHAYILDTTDSIWYEEGA